MEKRALLAFVLSLLVLTIWSYWFVPHEVPRPQQDESQEGERGQVWEAPKEGVKEGWIVSPLEQGPPRLQEGRMILVETPLYVASINTRGATIESWQLKRYKESLEESSPFVELVSRGTSSRALELRIQGPLEGEELNNRVFSLDREEVRITEGTSKEKLVAVLPLAQGGYISKEFTFYGDRYLVDVTVRACSAAGGPLGEKVGLTLRFPKGDVGSKSGVYGGPVALTSKGFEEIHEPAKYGSKAMDVIWGGMALHYFLSAVVPRPQGRGELALEDRDGTVTMTLWARESTGGSCDYSYRVYFGPKSIDDLKLAGEGLDEALHLGFFDFIARPLLAAMKFVNDYTHNYGIAIIVLTIVIKLLFWPLTHKSYVSMKELQRLQPRIQQIRERFKNDKEQLNREMMLIYRTHKVNPLGGCLPMLLQIPVFFALYKALMDSIELRHAPFIFWLKDLSAPDYVLRFPPGVSFFGIEGIGPLPLLMGASMVIQQKMTPSPGDPTQAKVMMLMPIFFTFLFISFPSGLVLYWLMNNVLSIVQQIYINAKVQ